MKFVGAAAVAVWTFVIVIALGEIYLARAEAPIAPCLTEDGSDTSLLCAWTDTETGTVYLNNVTN